MNLQDESEEGIELIQRLDRMREARCASCGKALCPHQVLGSVALGLGDHPRCLPCAARQMEQSPLELAETLFGYFHRRACFWAAWQRASQSEAVDPESIPSCFLAGPATASGTPVE